MPRKGPAPKRPVVVDPVYGSPLVSQLVSKILLDGKKTTAQSIVYDALEGTRTKTGVDPVQTLKKALGKYLKAGKGRKAELAVIETGCFDICPKDAVIAVNAAAPKQLLIVPVGADLLEVKARLGLEDGRRAKPSLTLIGR